MVKVNLSDICVIQAGGTPSRSNAEYWENGTIPWVKISDIKQKYLTETEEYISEQGLNNSSAKIFSRGTILFTIFATLGETCILDIDAATNQAIAGITINSEDVDKDYLYHYLRSKKTYVNFIGRGVAQNNINMGILRGFEILLPPLSKQQDIASVLGKIEDLISLRKQQLAKLDELVKARFVEMFGDPIDNPMNWIVSALKNVTSKIGAGATPKGGKESYHTEGITLIRSMNVHDGRFEYKDLAHINDDQAEQLNNVEVHEKDVFINITGASVARSCVVPDAVLPARVNQHVSIIRCKRPVFEPIFANQQFLNSSFKKMLLELGEAGGATRQAITKQQLEDLPVVVPPLELQEEFSVFVTHVGRQKLTIQQNLDILEVLKESLMQEYFG